MTYQESIVHSQELRWVTVTNGCRGYAGIEIRHGQPPESTVDVILVAPGMSVTIHKGRLIAAGIDNEHVTNFMVGASSDPNPCHYFPGSTRYITNARGKVTPLVC